VERNLIWGQPSYLTQAAHRSRCWSLQAQPSSYFSVKILSFVTHALPLVDVMRRHQPQPSAPSAWPVSDENKVAVDAEKSVLEALIAEMEDVEFAG
jgi:hypothetical protein